MELKKPDRCFCLSGVQQDDITLEFINRHEVPVMENPGGLNEQFARENLPEANC